MLRRAAIAAAFILSTTVLFAARQGGPIPVPLPLFPGNNWWNTDISNAPVDPNSADFIQFIGPTRALHPDFGGDAGGGDVYGFPFLIVDGAQPLKTVTFEFSDESDGVNHITDTSFPFYPIPDEAITMNGWVEGGQPGNIDQTADADRHVLIVDKTNNTLYELYNVWFNGTSWVGGSGAFFDMKTNDRRPEAWTSADAAGLAILPGLVRYDEIADLPEITHAFRVTVRATNDHVYPASHTAGSTADALPMGARLRLKASVDITGFPADVQKIFAAFKKCGLIVADNGSDMYISGTYDRRWNNDVLNPAFASLTANDFEIIQLAWQPPVSLLVTLPPAVTVGGATNVTVTAYLPTYNIKTDYTGTIHFTSSSPAAVPADYTFTAGDNGTHTFSATLSTAGYQTITATDMADPTITGSATVSGGPGTPSGLVATAASGTQINLTWDAPAGGAAQYEIERRTDSSGYTLLTTTAATSYTDSPVSAEAAYVYRVRAKNASSQPSAYSIPDAAMTFFFTDDPVLPGVTLVKAAHITQLRTAVNFMRAAAGLTATSFTNPTLGNTVVIQAVHLQELQDALNEARAALLLVPSGYHDATYEAGTTTVKAPNVQELRSGTK